MTISKACFPTPNAGETIGSIAARYHFQFGSRHVEDTSRLLFGYRSAHLNHECPVGLSRLSLLSSGRVDATEKTLRERTALGAYLALLPQSRRDDLVRLCAGSQAPAKAQAVAGLNRYNESLGLLKFCPDCLQQQLTDRGYSYWSASHQWPGVWLCLVHKRPLHFFVAANRKLRRWSLPDQTLTIATEPLMSVTHSLQVLRLQSVVAWLATRRSVESSGLQTVLKLRLRLGGFIRSELKISDVEASHLNAYARRTYESSPYPDIAKLNSRDWMRALLSDKRHYNPLSWAAALALHGSCDEQELSAEYNDAVERLEDRGLFDEWRDGPRRVTAPRILYGCFGQALRKNQAIYLSGLTSSEVDHWLRRDPSLKRHWHASLHDRRKLASVEEIKAYAVAYPRCRRIDVLRNCRSSYRWLEANYPSELSKILPPVQDKYSPQLPLPLE